MTARLAARGLYAIVDVTTLASRGVDVSGEGLATVAKAIVSAGPAALQLRAKGLSSRETLALLRWVAPVCREAGVPLFANDRPDLAVIAGCDGVHVGQDDVPVDDVRRFAPGLLVGVSTHDDAQVERAIAARPDYVAFGPVYPTASKANPDPVVGEEALARVVSRAPCPVVGIGGIDLDRARRIGQLGAVGAVISSLYPNDLDPASIKARAQALRAALVNE